MPRSDYVEVYRSGTGWRSRFVDSNGEIMATGAERYESKQHCVEGAQVVFSLPRTARKSSAWRRQNGGGLRWYR